MGGAGATGGNVVVDQVSQVGGSLAMEGVVGEEEDF